MGSGKTSTSAPVDAVVQRCGATFDLANGEFVTPCHLDHGHSGKHQGFVLGSGCQWPQGYASEEECYFDRPSGPTEPSIR